MELEELNLSSALSQARDLSVYTWARAEGKDTSTTALQRLREEFHRLPYSEKRKYHARPTKAMLRPDEYHSEDEVRAIAKAYKQSGDATHALRAVGVELEVPWVEQKRNAQGMVEILACDLFSGDMSGDLSPMETLETEARESGLYESVGGQEPATPEDELDSTEGADSLLALARERIDPQRFAMFLLVAVDGQPIRSVAREFGLSYRSVWQAVDSARDTLRSIAAERESVT